MKKVIKSIALLIMAAMVAASLTSLPACSDGGGEDKQQTEKKPSGPDLAKARKKAAEKKTDEAKEQKPEEKKEEEKKVYSYRIKRTDGQMKRDPFTHIRIDELTPVRSYDVSQLKVNGVIIHGRKTANIVTPNGKATKVHIGDKIGIHDGVVVNITLEGVKVRETYLDAKGRIQEIERFIKN